MFQLLHHSFGSRRLLRITGRFFKLEKGHRRSRDTRSSTLGTEIGGRLRCSRRFSTPSYGIRQAFSFFSVGLPYTFKQVRFSFPPAVDQAEGTVIFLGSPQAFVVLLGKFLQLAVGSLRCEGGHHETLQTDLFPRMSIPGHLSLNLVRYAAG